MPATNEIEDMKINREIIQRLLSKSKWENGCLVWYGAKDTDGYGFISINNKLKRVHRVVWEMFDDEIPEGIQVLHTCDNPPCIYLSHLFLGTQSDNLKDAVNKGRLNLSECGKKRSENALRASNGKFI